MSQNVRQKPARTPAPDFHESLSSRLLSMQRQVSTTARTGGGLGPAELERLGADLLEFVGYARSIEDAKPPRPIMNMRTLKAHEHLFDAQGAIEHAMQALRGRMKEDEPDPDGMILASIRTGQSIIASAEALLVGKMQS